MWKGNDPLSRDSSVTFAQLVTVMKHVLYDVTSPSPLNERNPVIYGFVSTQEQKQKLHFLRGGIQMVLATSVFESS